MTKAQTLIGRAETILLKNTHKTMTAASAAELHEAVATAAMEELAPVWVAREEARAAGRQAYYLSAEYLVGRLVYNNLYCMGLLDEVSSLLRERGVDPAGYEI